MAEIDDAAVGSVQRGLTKGASGEAGERLGTGHGHGRMRGDGRQRRRCGLAVQGGEANEGGLESIRLERNKTPTQSEIDEMVCFHWYTSSVKCI
jgi:hypothetical protein